MRDPSQRAGRRPQQTVCPQCSSQKTIQIDDHAGDLSFFCMSCEYTWTVTRQGATAGLYPLVPRTRDAILIPTVAPAANGRFERPANMAILRARATVERSRALLAIAVNLLRHALFAARRRRLVRNGEKAIH